MGMNTLRVSLIVEGVASLEIPANPYPMYPYAEVLNSVSVDSATGKRHVFAAGPVRVNANIEFKCLSHDFVKQYEAFILDHAWIGQIPFTMLCPHYIDFGNGKGVDIDNAYYAGPADLKDIIKPRGDAGLFYDIELPYMFLRGNYAIG